MLQIFAGAAVGWKFFRFSDYKNNYKDPDYAIWLCAVLTLIAAGPAISLVILISLYLTIAKYLLPWLTMGYGGTIRQQLTAFAAAYLITLTFCTARVRLQDANFKKLLRKKFLRMRKPKLEIVARQTGTY